MRKQLRRSAEALGCTATTGRSVEEEDDDDEERDDSEGKEIRQRRSVLMYGLVMKTKKPEASDCSGVPDVGKFNGD